MATPIKKGQPFNCSMFGVHCNQPCVRAGVRITSKCPYNNYNSHSTMYREQEMILRKSVYPSKQEVDRMNKETQKQNKGATSMSKETKPKSKSTSNASSDFKPTFKKYKDMTPDEQAIFKQGCTTANNSIKESLGLKKKRENK